MDRKMLRFWKVTAENLKIRKHLTLATFVTVSKN